jgi:threonine/homoserine/homoserine lactone efflux protein
VALGTAVLTFAVVALALTLTPGPDTALVLRAALTRSRRDAAATAAGIVAGLFAYDVLRVAGAAYLVWFGVRLLVRAVRGIAAAEAAGVPDSSPWRAARQGLVTNLLNPKVGVFYVALIPQFLPSGSNSLAVGLLLAAVHGAISGLWFALLIGLASALGRWLRRPATVRAIDGVTGTTLIGFGVKLAVSR